VNNYPLCVRCRKRRTSLGLCRVCSSRATSSSPADRRKRSAIMVRLSGARAGAPVPDWLTDAYLDALARRAAACRPLFPGGKILPVPPPPWS